MANAFAMSRPSGPAILRPENPVPLCSDEKRQGVRGMDREGSEGVFPVLAVGIREAIRAVDDHRSVARVLVAVDDLTEIPRKVEEIGQTNDSVRVQVEDGGIARGAGGAVECGGEPDEIVESNLAVRGEIRWEGGGLERGRADEQREGQEGAFPASGRFSQRRFRWHHGRSPNRARGPGSEPSVRRGHWRPSGLGGCLFRRCGRCRGR